MDFKNLSIVKIGTTIAAVGAIFGALIAFDDRYNNQPTLVAIEALKVSLINEMRTEITINRSAMISNMQRDADDLEFQIAAFVEETPPRYLVEKHKQLNRDIEELKSHGNTSDD